MTKRIEVNHDQKTLSGGIVRGRRCRKCGADHWYRMQWYNGPGWRCGKCALRFGNNWRAKNQSKYRDWSWRQRGIDMTVERYHALEEKQGYSCALCRKPTKHMVVDHDHATGQTRGLLCRRCNVLAQEPDVLRHVLQYVEAFRQ